VAVLLWLSVLLPSPAYADVALPSLILVCPAMALLLPLIIFLEAAMAERILDIDYNTSLKIAGAANLRSTFLGIPLAWVLLLAFWLLMLPFSTASGREGWPPVPTIANALFWGATTEYSPASTVYVGMALMWVAYFLVSVWYEARVAREYVEIEKWQQVQRWAWLANGTSYGVLVLIQFLLVTK